MFWSCTLSLVAPLFFLSCLLLAQEEATRDPSPSEALAEASGEDAAHGTNVKEGEPDEAPKQFQAFRLGEVDPDVARRVTQTLLNDDPAARIEVDAENNRLLFYGTEQQAQVVSKVLKAHSDVAHDADVSVDASGEGMLDRQPLEQARGVTSSTSSDGFRSSRGTREKSNRVQRVFTLKHPVDAKDVVRRFERLFRNDGKWAVNVSANQIRFSGTEEQMQSAADLVAELNKRAVKIFSLQYADATELAALIKELFPSPALTVVANARTSSIVASGPPEDLEMMSAVLLRLDEPAAKETHRTQTPRGKSPAGPALSDKSKPRGDTASQLLTEYEAAERVAADSAKAYRMAKQSGDLPEEHLDKMKANVTSAVERAFELRQRLQSAEVEHLRERLNQIEARVRQREALKDRIIERRVEDLVTDADLSWSSPTHAAPNARPDVAVRQAPSKDVVQQAVEWASLKGTVQVDAIPGKDMLRIRGHAADVEAFTKVVDELEKRGATPRDSEDEQANPARTDEARPIRGSG